MGYGHSIRRAGTCDTLDNVMLLYIGVKGADWTVSRWYSSIASGGLEATEEHLVKLGQKNDSKAPEFKGYGFEGINFEGEQAYFTIVLDWPGYDFHDDEEHGIDPMWFVEKKENCSIPAPPNVGPNQGFCDFARAEISGLPAYRGKNLLLNGHTGKPLEPGEEQGFIFNIYLRANCTHDDSYGVVLTIDPDGTSMGPQH